MKKILPIYDVVLLNEETGVFKISLVDEPAIEVDFIVQFKKEPIQFKQTSNDKQILIGPLLIPNKLIYRNQNNQEYFIRYSEKVIRDISEDFLKNKRIDSINEMHLNKDVKDCYMIESWIIEDEEKDKSVLYGFNLPKGTWMCTLKVNNKEYWDEYIKTGEFKGFSIEGILGHYYTGEMAEIQFNKESELLLDNKTIFRLKKFYNYHLN